MSVLSNKKGVPEMEKAINGFETIGRSWDRQRECYAAKILPGEFYVTKHSEIITTVLGSCVSACIRDPDFAIGGMNHFMLPASKEQMQNMSGMDSEAARYGNYAMEQLINEILKNGGRKSALEIKLFGGGRVLQNMTHSDIGNRNINFVLEYLKTEGLKSVAEDLGDVYPRKVIYNPLTGKVNVKRLRSTHNDTIVKRETGYMQDLQKEPVSGDVELF